MSPAPAMRGAALAWRVAAIGRRDWERRPGDGQVAPTSRHPKACEPRSQRPVRDVLQVVQALTLFATRTTGTSVATRQGRHRLH